MPENKRRITMQKRSTIYAIFAVAFSLAVFIGGYSAGAAVKIKSIANVSTSVAQGADYNLPKTVQAIMSNNSKKNVSITWKQNNVNTDKPGKYTIQGSVKGYSKTVTLTVTVKLTSISFHIKNVKFGMTLAQVRKAIAGEPSTVDDGFLEYTGTMNNLDATIGCFFNDDGKLYDVSVTFKEEHDEENDFIADYNNLEDQLTPSYGEAQDKDDQYGWVDDTLQDDPNSYGLAVSSGDLIISSTRADDAMTITHTLSGEDYEITHELDFKSKTIIGNDDGDDSGE